MQEPKGLAAAKTKQNTFELFQITDQGAWLMPYETLINPSTVELEGFALALGAGEVPFGPARRPQQGICWTTFLWPLQSHDGTHKRYYSKFLCNNHDPASQNR